MSADTLQVRFASPDALRSEFDKNIANRGVFVATEEAFEVRSSVSVEIILEYVHADAPALVLDGEIVHVLPPEMAGSGATPGVAVQFEASAHALRARFEPLLSEAPPAPPDADVQAPGRRESRRGAVRVPVRVARAGHPPVDVTSRDLSATGILLSNKSEAMPVGEIVRLGLRPAEGGALVEIDGKVVRHVANKSGRVAAVAIAFDKRRAGEPAVRSLIDALREAGHRSRLGGINGTLAELGLANVLQMFGASAPQGTLIVERDGEQGWIAFANGTLLAAELGELEGHDALVAMLGWGEGFFQFEASADPELVEQGGSTPLVGAVLEAVCAVDEAARGDAPGASSGVAIRDETVFSVDASRLEGEAGALDKTGDAILELARAGMSVERLVSVIPEPEATIRAAIDALVEQGVLVPQAD